MYLGTSLDEVFYEYLVTISNEKKEIEKRDREVIPLLDS